MLIIRIIDGPGGRRILPATDPEALARWPRALAGTGMDRPRPRPQTQPPPRPAA
jgi:hypothetical protein